MWGRGKHLLSKSGSTHTHTHKYYHRGRNHLKIHIFDMRSHTNNHWFYANTNTFHSRFLQKKMNPVSSIWLRAQMRNNVFHYLEVFSALIESEMWSFFHVDVWLEFVFYRLQSRWWVLLILKTSTIPWAHGFWSDLLEQQQIIVIFGLRFLFSLHR